MLKQEFEKLVGMVITQEEYDAIEIVYTKSDVDKFDFCRYWQKMNESRIASYRTAQKEKEQAQRTKYNLLDIAAKLRTKGNSVGFDSNASLCLTKSDTAILDKFGIKTNGITIRSLIDRLVTITNEIYA